MYITIPNVTTTNNYTFPERWKFCPKDGQGLQAEWNHCPKCGTAIPGVVSFGQPQYTSGYIQNS